MKNKLSIIHYPLSIIILFFLAGACTSVIDLEDMRPDPKLVMNSLVTSGEPVSVRITRTWFHTEENPEILIENADVRLYVNGKEQEKLAWIDIPIEDDLYTVKHARSYCSEYIPRINDHIRLVAHVDGYPDAEAETTIPEPVAISNFQVISREEIKDNQKGTAYYYQVTFQDDPATDNYYLIFFEDGSQILDENDEPTGEYLWRSVGMDFLSEPIFGGQLSAFDKVMGYDSYFFNGYFFSDELIRGKEYMLNIRNDRFYYGGGYDYAQHIRVSLYTVSESYYRYFKSLYELKGDTMGSDLSNIGLAEPVRVYNNVAGGVGILGGYTPMQAEVHKRD